MAGEGVSSVVGPTKVDAPLGHLVGVAGRQSNRRVWTIGPESGNLGVMLKLPQECESQGEKESEREHWGTII